jgi:PAS domain S-box-containing protein
VREPKSPKPKPPLSRRVVDQRSSSFASPDQPRAFERPQLSGELLAKARQELSNSLDYQATLKAVTDLIVPAFADDCLIFVKNENGDAELVADTNADPERGELIHQTLNRLNPREHPQVPLFRVLATGTSMLIHDPPFETLRTTVTALDEELYRIAVKLGIRSRIVVPLKARGEIIGAMNWLSVDKSRLFTNDDRRVAEEIALSAAYAIDNARLYEAEKLANQRLNDLLNGLQASVREGRGDPIEEVTFVNQPAEGLFGYSAEKLKDPNFSRKMVLEADAAKMAEQYNNGLRSGRDFEVEYRARRGDGRVIWIRDMVRVTRSADGSMMVRAVTTDITEHKQAEERLRVLAEAGRTLDSSLDYETTLTNVTAVIVPALADDCIIFLESDHGKLEMVTSAHSDPSRAEIAREFFRHYPLIERPDQPLQMVHRTGQSVLMQDAMAAIDVGVALSREQYEASIGTHVNAGLAVPLRSRGQILGVMVWVCVESGRHYGREDLKLAEEIANRAALAVDNARLFKAAQDGVAARDRFLAMLGHELRNPLNSIGLVAKMLERESLSDERLTKLRALIGRETRQLSTLVDDLLDVSRVLAGKMNLALESVDLAALVRDSAQSFEDVTRQRELKLAVSIPNEPMTIVGDPVRIHQVIANLLTNAIKFTEPPGRVEVTLRGDSHFAMLSVRDTGIGIASEMLERIFEPFAQATLQPPHGLGLGLAVVKQVTELHGGRVSAASAGVGKGSEFSVRLPRATMQ